MEYSLHNSISKAMHTKDYGFIRGRILPSVPTKHFRGSPSCKN